MTYRVLKTEALKPATYSGGFLRISLTIFI